MLPQESVVSPAWALVYALHSDHVQFQNTLNDPAAIYQRAVLQRMHIMIGNNKQRCQASKSCGF